jgi:hypothetical protein
MTDVNARAHLSNREAERYEVCDGDITRRFRWLHVTVGVPYRLLVVL